MNKFLSFDDINEVDDAEYTEIDIPEWNGTLRVRGLNGGERAEFEEQVSKNHSMRHAKVECIIKCSVDDEGNRVFTNQHKGMLLGKSAKVIERIFDEICRLSGIGDDAEGEAEGN
jgi:hypothetical protein